MFAYSDSAVYFSWSHFISLPSFMGLPNTMRILYRTSVLTELQAFFKPKTPCALSHGIPFFIYQLFGEW
jgi:hypothetical protein